MRKYLEIIRADEKVNPKVLRDEINQRTYLAGHTDRDGQPKVSKTMAAVGLGEPKLNVWPRDKNGNLVED